MIILTSILNFTFANLWLYLLFLIAGAQLALQIANRSTLAFTIKNKLGLVFDNPNPRYLLFADIHTYINVIGYKASYMLYVLILPVMVIIKVYHLIVTFLRGMLNCPECLSYSIGMFINIYLFSVPVLFSLFLSCITINFVQLVEQLSKNNEK
jgi:hypothetical protein